MRPLGLPQQLYIAAGEAAIATAAGREAEAELKLASALAQSEARDAHAAQTVAAAEARVAKASRLAATAMSGCRGGCHRCSGFTRFRSCPEGGRGPGGGRK